MFKDVCIVFSLLLLVLCLFWRVRLAQTEERIAALEDAIEKAENEGRVLTARYESSMSLEELDAYARQVLGMQPPGPEQIIYTELPG